MNSLAGSTGVVALGSSNRFISAICALSGPSTNSFPRISMRQSSTLGESPRKYPSGFSKLATRLASILAATHSMESSRSIMMRMIGSNCRELNMDDGFASARLLRTEGLASLPH